jgi:hypothetical protein
MDTPEVAFVKAFRETFPEAPFYPPRLVEDDANRILAAIRARGFDLVPRGDPTGPTFYRVAMRESEADDPWPILHVEMWQRRADGSEHNTGAVRVYRAIW